jgi:hypothetical protein
VEEGGVVVSCDEEGRRGVGWHATEPPAVATIEEEGRSKVAPPCMRERERVVATALNLGEIEMNGRERESHGRKERESRCYCSTCVDKERERKMRPHVCEKTHNLCDTFSGS